MFGKKKRQKKREKWGSTKVANKHKNVINEKNNEKKLSVQVVSTAWRARVRFRLHSHRVRGHACACRATHGLPPQTPWCAVGVLAWTHQCALRCPSRMASGAKRQSFVVVGVVAWS